MPYYPLTINVQSPNQTFFFKFLSFKSTSTNTKHGSFLKKSQILHYLQQVISYNQFKVNHWPKSAAQPQRELSGFHLWTYVNDMNVCLCVCVRSHTFEGNRFNTDGTGRLHSWIQTHFDLTVTLYTASLPTTLNWALSHSHLFHSMQTSQNTDFVSRPFPTHPRHTIWVTLVTNFLSTQRSVPKNSTIYRMYRYYISFWKWFYK